MSSLLFPDRCYYCGEFISNEKIHICKKCIASLPLIKGNRCELCGREEFSCNCKIGDFPFVQNISFMRYDGSCESIIKRFKFGNLPQLSSFIGDELASFVKSRYSEEKFDYVTYVPMHPIDEFRRQYNQSELLAKRVARKLDVPLVDSLKKRFTFKHQKQLKRDERLKSIKGTFKAKRSFDNSIVLLIDDVFTTGATLSECTRMLREAGAEKVYTATFAISYKK